MQWQGMKEGMVECFIGFGDSMTVRVTLFAYFFGFHLYFRNDFIG